jgi:hypothetical protein
VANEYDYALVFGINDYTSFTPLQGAVNDAEHFYKWLVSPTGGDLPPGNITKIVSNGVRAEPSFQEVENKIEPYIAKYVANPGPLGRRLYIFLAGHGVDVGSEDCGLVTADATEVLNSRVVPGLGLAIAFKRSRAFGQVVLFMDCCREVTMRNPPKGDWPVLNFLEKQESSSCLLRGLATQWSQLAGERLLPNPDGQGESVQGIFTYALLDGLCRAGDDEGKITVERLRGYVLQFMSVLGTNQVPTILCEPEDIEISRPGPGSTTVLVTLPAGQTTFDVRDGGKQFQRIPFEPAEAGERTWSVSLRPGAYVIGTPSGKEIPEYAAAADAYVVGKEFRVGL